MRAGGKDQKDRKDLKDEKKMSFKSFRSFRSFPPAFMFQEQNDVEVSSDLQRFRPAFGIECLALSFQALKSERPAVEALPRGGMRGPQ